MSRGGGRPLLDRGGNGANGHDADAAPRVVAKRGAARIIAGPSADIDPRERERERLLGRLLAADGRRAITQATTLFVEAGFTFPDNQDVWLQLLEHHEESFVMQAIEHLDALLQHEEPKRRAVLESRLRRIEEVAEEATTRKAASALRRLLHTRYAETLSDSVH
jgi:hypothetical protein